MGSRLASLIIGAVIAATAQAGAAWGAAQCPPPSKTPHIDLTVDQGKVTYDHTKGAAEISGLARRYGGKVHAELGRVSGLTAGLLNISMNFQMQVQPVADGSYCVWITDVAAKVGYDAMIVYVDKRYRPGSCAYNTVMTHENEHVMINRRVLDAYTQPIADALQAAVVAVNPIVTRSIQATQSGVGQMVRDRMNAVFKAHEKTLQAAQSPLDTPENYQRVHAKCADW